MKLIFITEGNLEVSNNRIKGFETIASQNKINYQIIETSNEREVIFHYMQKSTQRV